jgi:hypothetical protein
MLGIAFRKSLAGNDTVLYHEPQVGQWYRQIIAVFQSTLRLGRRVS